MNLKSDKSQGGVASQSCPPPTPSADLSAGGAKHVAIIMDGNGRWAKERSKPRIFGHRQGANAINEVMKAAQKHNLKYLTLYAFSSENWSRPKAEVEALMKLLVSSINRYEKNFLKNKIRFSTIGDLSALPKESLDAVERLKKITAAFDEFTLVLALNYGSRDEILRASAAFAKANAGQKNINKPSWEEFSKYLDTAFMPDPDLIIRTSGELRLSNFLMMQSAYSELYFTDVYWPDFTEAEFDKAMNDYNGRERRYGKTGEQLK